MAEFHDFLLRLINHSMQGINLFLLRVEFIFNDLYEHVYEAAVINLIKIAVIKSFVLIL